MNWKQRLFKPKWQNKIAEIRLESVTTEQHPDLIGSLVEIAGNDEDARVRCAAIKRLHQLENILKVYSGETDSTVRTLLEDRIRQLASSSNESRPALALRLQVAESTSDRDLIEHLAGHAPEAELRRAAIAKVERQGVLGDCCVADSDAENRRFAASRINQQTTLKRVISELRKRDKALYADLQARLHEELLQQGDAQAVQTEATSICLALEKMSLDAEHRTVAEEKAQHDAWQRIATKTSTDMAGRYQRICERLAAPLTRPEAEEAVVPEEKLVVEEPVDIPLSEAVEVASTVEPVANKALARLAADICTYEQENPSQLDPVTVGRLSRQLEKLWKSCSPAHSEDEACWTTANTALQNMDTRLESQRQQLEEQLSQAQASLTQMESELEQGALHKALETRAKLQQLTKEHAKDRNWKQISTRMTGMQPRLRELREWHHWSNNKVRKRLIAEMEVLPAADLHPDALLDRIKSLQMEWKTLEQSEQIPGDKSFVAAPWMWRKFSAAGHTAFDTAKPFLDKRSEIQSRHAQSLATFCAELEQLAEAQPTDWTALGKGLTRGRKKLHDLNNVPANQRQKIARKLKATLDKANAVVQARYESVEKEKMKLIRSASQLIHMPERADAIAQAKSLQSNWKAAGSLWRSKEQELWNQFREHVDPLFSELKEQQESIRAADGERLKAQKALCAELKTILEQEQDLSAMHGKVQGLQDAWKDIQHTDRKLMQSFQDMVEKYQQRLELAKTQLVKAKRERSWTKAELLHDLTVNGRTLKGTISKKAETAVTKAWPQDKSEGVVELELDQSLQDLLAGNIDVLAAHELEQMKARARQLCIGLEFIAGLSSPDEDRDQRMKYQVDRLAETMSGETARLPATEEALSTEKIWLGMYALPEPEFSQFRDRIKLATNTILENV